MADENRLHDLLDLVEQARKEGDKNTESKAIAAYHRESAPQFPDSSQNPRIPNELPSLPGAAPKPDSKSFSKAPQEGVLDDVGRVVKSVAGPAIAGIAGVGENLLSGASGVVHAANNAVGTLMHGRHTGALPLPEYHPQTEGGQALESSPIPRAMGRAVQKGADKVSEVTGDPDAGESAKDLFTLATAAAPSILKGARGTPKSGASVPKGPIPEQPVEALRAAGYKIRPSDAETAAPEVSRTKSSALEGFAGSDSLRKSFVKANQKTTTSLGAQQIGLPAETPRLTEKDFSTQRTPHVKKYEEVGNAVPKFAPTDEYGASLDAVSQGKGLSPKARRDIARDVDQYRSQSMTGPDTVKTISVLRRRSIKEQASQDVNVNDMGDAHRAIADALESELERQLTSVGDDKLLGEFRNARTELAKINDIDTATKGGQVDAAVLHKLNQRGVKLSGHAKVVADAYEMAPHVLKHGQSISSIGDSISPALGVTADVLTAGVRPAARAFLRSDLYQNTLGKTASRLGPGEALGDYFQKNAKEGGEPPSEPPPNGPTGRPPRLGGPPPSPFKPSRERTMLEAQKRSGDLSLADELANPEQLPESPAMRYRSPRIEATREHFDGGAETTYAPAPDRDQFLTADAPAEQRGDIPFKGSAPLAATLADDLGLGEAPTGGIPGGQSPRAAGQAGNLELKENARVDAGPPGRVGGNRLSDDLIGFNGKKPKEPYAPFRGGVEYQDPGALGQHFTPDQMREAGQLLQSPHGLTLEGEPGAIPSTPESPAPSTPPEGGSPAPQAHLGFDLAKDLGIEIAPSAKGGFELRVPGEKTASRFSTRDEAKKAALTLADELLGDLEPAPASKPRVKNDPEATGKGQLSPDAYQGLFAEHGEPGALENNASGESAASVEAINRVASEKTAGQKRYLIDKNGEITPLTGVDSVDAVARPGQVIVQRGVGDKPYTVLDRGGLSRRAAENKISMVQSLLDNGE